ncbi:MAG TPA: hypothetical protein VFJ21_13270 [Mycobacteriales bacterium]|nr:hypothetical protein [Mycobacteriales bacterium]
MTRATGDTGKPGTYSRRLAAIREQHAYERRIEAFGLTALLAPYTLRPVVRLPRQRQG